jgi:hypothetical protein
MSNQNKAENLRYLYFFKPRTLKKCLCGGSLKQGFIIGLCLLIFLEMIYYIMGYKKFPITEPLFIGLIIWSLIKVVIYVQYIYGINKGRFDICYFSYLIFMFFIWVHIIMTLVGIALYFIYDNFIIICIVPKITFYLINLKIYTAIIYVSFSIALHLFIALVGYSFIKTIGIHELVIFQNETSFYTPPVISEKLTPGSDVILSINALNGNKLNIDCNGQCSCDDSNSEETAYPIVCEKIILCTQEDISFANSAHNAIVNNAILPSGLVVPEGREGRLWRVFGNEVILVPENN